MLDQNFVIIGVVIGALGVISYVIDTIKGKIKPNKVTYLLWSLAPLIAFFAQINQGVGLESLVTLSVGIFPLTVLIASFVNKNAYWKLTRFDLYCGGLSLIGLLLWFLTQVGNVAILFGILADGLAALPTIRKPTFFPKPKVLGPGWPQP